MPEEEVYETTINLQDVSDDSVVCPFSVGRWKKVGDTLVLFMLFVMPVLYLIAILMII